MKLPNTQLILPKSKIMLTSASDVVQVTNPLRKHGITMFSYTRVYNDGSFIDVSDRSDMISYFYYQTDIYKHYAPDANPSSLGTGYVILTSAEIASSPLAPVRDDVNLDNSLSIIKKHKQYYEVYNYASYKNNHAVVNFYLNNIDYLEAYSVDFTDKMQRLIGEYEKDKIWRPNIYTDASHSKIDVNDSVNHSAKEIFSTYRLSHRQQQCAHLLMQGKTVKEIANALNLSTRTIEFYLANMKSKLTCRNMAQLIFKLSTAII